MKKWMFRAAALLACSAAAFAQNVVGDWQGTLSLPNGRSLRIVMKITRAADESLKTAFYSIDQPSPPLSASSTTLQGTAVKMAIPAIGGNYEGKLSSDGNSIAGTWSQGGQPLTLNLERATPTTAWAIPDPPPPPKLMPADAKPVFEVATIKPANPETPGKSMLVGRGGGNLFTTTNSTVAELVSFAYGMHAKQITGGPGWITSEAFDITAKPDQGGSPSIAQLRGMVQKLLTERFQLTFHREKKELSAYVLTVGKGGVKMAKVEGNLGNLPGFGGRGPGNIAVRNSNMAEFAEFLQSRILERPVVDETALTDRYNFTLQWTPDTAPTGPGGAPTAPPPPTTAMGEAPPDLFTAMLQQLGLKIESGKAPVEVLVIDKITKPSEN